MRAGLWRFGAGKSFRVEKRFDQFDQWAALPTAVRDPAEVEDIYRTGNRYNARLTVSVLASRRSDNFRAYPKRLIFPRWRSSSVSDCCAAGRACSRCETNAASIMPVSQRFRWRTLSAAIVGHAGASLARYS